MQQTFYDFSAFEILKGKKPLLVCDNAFDFWALRFRAKLSGSAILRRTRFMSMQARRQKFWSGTSVILFWQSAEEALSIPQNASNISITQIFL